MLSQLADKQEEYRSLLQAEKEAPDKSYRSALSGIAILNMDEEHLIAVAVVRNEMIRRDEPELRDIVWAGEVIDHLDTLGWKLERK